MLAGGCHYAKRPHRTYGKIHMITLFGFGAGFGLPEISPYVTKTEVQLKMAGLAYRKERGQPGQSPKGQMPFIQVGDERVADSTFIRAFLEWTYSFDLDQGLDERQRAEAWAIERMCENQLAWTGIHFRWLVPENFDAAPEATRESLREQAVQRVRAAVHAVGVGRHSEPEILELAERSLAALSAMLGDRPYLMGQRPCGADATVFALLAAVLTPYFEGELKRRAEGFGTLVAYVDRLMARFYPEFDWDLETSLRAPVAA